MLSFLLALACKEAPQDDGLLGGGWMAPYPSQHLIDAQGHVHIEPQWVPSVDTPMPTERLSWRQGFSVSQTAMLHTTGIDADHIRDDVWLVDLDTQELLPSFAELDALDATVLLVRPLKVFPKGHQIAVVLGEQVLSRPTKFQAVLDGERLPEWQQHYQDLLAQVSAVVPTDSVSFSWDFPVDGGTEQLEKMAAETHATGQWTWLDEDTTNLPVGTYKQLTGTFEADDWLVDDFLLELDQEGMPQVQGVADAHLFVHIPESVVGAAPGSVPVLIFGHGLLQSPEGFLRDKDDPSNFVELFDRMGVIVIASQWRGLCRDDLVDVVWAANDMGRLPEVTNRMAQGVVNNLALMELIQDGDLLSDPVFEGLADPQTLLYYGVSLGGIMGAVTLAQTDRIDHGVLHVGGGAWSLTFPRSANWTDFENLVEEGIPASADRQLLYAMMQLYWDPVDSMSYTEELADRSLLLQMSVNDDEVTNIGTLMLAKSAGWPVLQSSEFGLESVSAPSLGPVLAPFDPQFDDPDHGNQPSERTGAHREPRMWESAKLQASTFLVQDPGTVQHFCTQDVCTDGDLR